MADSNADIEDRLRPHVEYVLDNLFKPGELSEWRFDWRGDGVDGPRNVAVSLTARSESYYGFLWEDYPDHPPEAGLDVFADGVEDFISESKFAWGQERVLAQRPWTA